MNASPLLPIVAVDLAKSVFQLAVADHVWRVIEQHRLTRSQFERWFLNRAVGLVIMEACSSAHHCRGQGSLQGPGVRPCLLPLRPGPGSGLAFCLFRSSNQSAHARGR